MSLARGPLFLMHGILATLIVLGLSMHLQQREQDVEKILPNKNPSSTACAAKIPTSSK
jgi:hypothetical protein